MKTCYLKFIYFILVITVCLNSGAQTSDDDCSFYAVEINNVLCGYAKLYSARIVEKGKEVHQVTGQVEVKLSVLGGGVDMHINYFYKGDPVTRQFSSFETLTKTGPAELKFTADVKNDTIYYISHSTGERKKIGISEDILLEMPDYQPYIMKDFIKGNLKEKTYKIFEPTRGEITEKICKKTGEEDLILSGKKYSCIILEENLTSLGVLSKNWYSKENGLNVQTLVSSRKIYLSDQSVVKQISIANLDNVLFARVNKNIPDIHNIVYMKVKAKIESAGEKLTSQNLNVTGQKFTGNVTDNVVEGIFEMEPVRYIGEATPAFPPDFSKNEGLQKYLKAESLIESSDPSIVNEAERITAGSANSWEAVKRLSGWVAENIEGAVPGGTSAINTYKTRQGECGSHSRLLAAFCRAVGIPARLAAGGMYTTNFGGSFGQHAWTEVYMGEKGWIPVDATAFEIDFIDAGHMRLGERSSFNPKEMEILEYRMKDGIINNTETPADYQPYLGKYADIRNNRIFTVLYQQNSLAVDIPGQTTLVLNEPDDESIWYPKLTRQVGFLLPKETTGLVEKMIIKQNVIFPRKSDSETETGNIPEKFQQLVGSYFQPQANLTFTFQVENDRLVVNDPMKRVKSNLNLQEKNGKWLDDKGFFEFEFQPDEAGKVNTVKVYFIFVYPKGEPVTSIIEDVISKSGIKDAILKYKELKELNSPDHLFSEGAMNLLGYRLLNQNKITEAIEIFRLNSGEYPESFNVYDSLGEAYMKNGERELAIKNYERSLDLNPDNENGKKMLAKLKQGE